MAQMSSEQIPKNPVLQNNFSTWDLQNVGTEISSPAAVGCESSLPLKAFFAVYRKNTADTASMQYRSQYFRFTVKHFEGYSGFVGSEMDCSFARDHKIAVI